MTYLAALPNTRIHTLPQASLSSGRRRVLYSASPQSLGPSAQSRALWGSSHRRHNCDRHRHKILDDHQRLRLLRERFKAGSHCHPEKAVYHHHHPWTNSWSGWGGGSSFPGFRGGKAFEKGIWETAKSPAQQRLKRIKEEIDADPYAAIFGRRLEPFGSGIKLENTFTSLCRSFLGLDKASDAADTPGAKKRSLQDSPTPKPQRSEDGESRRKAPEDLKSLSFEFDPISGRMVPKTSRPLDLFEDVDIDSVPRTETQPQQSTFKPERVSSPPQKREITPKSQNPLEPTVEGSSIGESVIPEIPQQNESASGYITTSQDEHPTSSTKTQDSPNNILDNTQGSPKAIHAGPPRTEEHTQTPANYEKGNVIVRRESACETQDQGIGEIRASEPPIMEHRNKTDDLERPGFLSRPGRVISESAISDQVQGPVLEQNKDANIDSLTARDIRAPYEMMRMKQGTEVHTEKQKDLGDSFNIGTASTSVAHHEPKTSQEESLDSLNESPSLTSFNPNGQTVPSTQPETRVETPGSVNPRESDNSTRTEVYRVFAYDPSTLQVIEAETSSSLQPVKEALHPTEILPRLNNPAKFLPCLNQMHASGYEIVSGGGDILVFKQALRPGNQKMDDPPEVTGTQAGFNGDGSARSAASSHSEHTIFGPGDSLNHSSSAHESPSRPPPRSTSNKVLRRMLIGGTATAATCYALGVVGQYFRTGGQDGIGIDGFTEFESERRHR